MKTNKSLWIRTMRHTRLSTPEYLSAVKALNQREHCFTLVVKAQLSRRAAEQAVLSAFALRKPDYCEFHLRKNAPKKSK